MAQEIGLRGRLDLSKFNNEVRSFISQIQRVNQETTRVAQTTSTETKKAESALARFGISWGRIVDIITGVSIIDVFRTIRRGISDIVSEALNATDAFQRLTIRLEAILARDFANKFGGTTAEALRHVTGQAQELLGWIRELAVSTPFSVQTIADAVAYGQAFGFNVAQTQRMTSALVDFTSGMGLTDEHFLRILYNMGQMLASGRVLGRELRDLANNFVPVGQVLQFIADESGATLAEVQKWQKEGTLSAEQFISAFVQIAEKDFPGAAQRMSRTINGVRENIRDFIQTLLGMELLGPVMAEVAANLADILESIFTPETTRAFALIGESILQAFILVRDAIGRVVDALGGFLSALGITIPTAHDLASVILTVARVFQILARFLELGIIAITDVVDRISANIGFKLGDLVRQAREWGSNIIVALAQGMASAISFVISAITYIANAIASLLRAFSPPAILPDLPKWGQAAMQSWLEGWLQADFSIFNNVAGIIERFLRSIPGGIGKDNLGLIPAILGARAEIAKAIAGVRSGLLSVGEAINLVTKSTKGITGDLKAYVQALFAVEFAQKKVADATKAVEAAQESLNDITNKYSKLIGDLQKQLIKVTDEFDEQNRLKEIEEALNSGLLTAEEKAKLEAEKQAILIGQQIRLLEEQRDTELEIADAQLEAARASQAAAQAQLKAAQEQLEVSKQSIEFQIKNNELLQEQLALLERLAKEKAAGGAGSEADAFDLEGFDFTGFEDLESAIEDAKKGVVEEVDRMAADIQAALFRLLARVKAPFLDLKDEFTLLLTGITATFDELKENPKLQAFVLIVQQFARDVMTALGNLRLFWEENGEQILGLISQFFERLGEAVSPSIAEGFTLLLGAISTFGDKLVEWSELLVESGPQIRQSLQDWIDWVFEEGIPKLSDFADVISDKVFPVVRDIGGFIIENLPAILPLLFGLSAAFRLLSIILTILSPFLTPLLDFLTILAISGAGLSTVTGPLSGISGTLAGIASTIAGSTFIADIGAFIGLLLTEGGAAFSLINPLLVIFAVAVASVVAAFVKFPGSVKEVVKILKGAFASAMKILGPAINTVGKAFATLGAPLKLLRDELQPIVDLILKVLGGVGVGLILIFVTLATDALALFSGLVSGAASAISTAIGFLRFLILMVSVIFSGIKDVVSGIWDTIVGIFTLNGDLILSGVGKTFLGVGKIVVGFFAGLIAATAQGFAVAFSFVKGFVEGVIQFFKGLYDALVGKSIIPDMLEDIKTVFKEKLAEVVEVVKTWISNVIVAIKEKIEDFIKAGKEIIENFKQGIVEKFGGEDGVIATVATKITEVLNKIGERLQDFKDRASELIESFKQGIVDKFVDPATGVIQTLKNQLQAMLDAAIATLSSWWEFGKDIVLGIAAGIAENAQKAIDAIGGIIKDTLKSAKNKSKAKSPAETFKPIGASWVDGVIVGMQSRATHLRKVFSDMVDELSAFEVAPQVSLPTDAMNRLYSQGASGGSFSGMPGMSGTFNRNTNINVDAHYANQQSPAGIYYDVSAALAHTSR